LNQRLVILSKFGSFYKILRWILSQPPTRQKPIGKHSQIHKRLKAKEALRFI